MKSITPKHTKVGAFVPKKAKDAADLQRRIDKVVKKAKAKEKKRAAAGGSDVTLSRLPPWNRSFRVRSIKLG